MRDAEQLPFPGVTEAFMYEDIEDAVSELLLRAHIARDDVSEMFSLVMKAEPMSEEQTDLTIETMPHQRLIFAFVEATKTSVIRMPVGTSKTFCMSALTMHLLGRNPNSRGAIVSATEKQAAKVVGQIRTYIEESPELRLVYPDLKPSTRQGDPWSQNRLVVERTGGIRDASLVAIGIDTQFQGSRYSWVLVDDVLNQLNCMTPTGREHVHRFFDGSILGRLDPGKYSKIVVTNTPWNRDDLTYRLAAIWPAMTMSIYGDITFNNVDLEDPQWAEVVALVRPSDVKPGAYRLREHDPDPHDQVPLWPERFPLEEIEEIRGRMLPQQFAQTYLCQAVDDASSQCPQAWIDPCIVQGVGIPFLESLSADELRDIDPKAVVVTGIDLAAKKANVATALTVLFTVVCYSDGKIQPIKVDAGRYTMPEIVDLCLAHHERYNSVLFVEETGVQSWILDSIARQGKGRVPAYPHFTGKNKHHWKYGVGSVFNLMRSQMWIIPNEDKVLSREMKMWLDQCRDFDPTAHMGDLLAASWIAVQGADQVMRKYAEYFQSDSEEEDVGVKIFGT